MEGHCSTGQSPQWAVVPMEEVNFHLEKVKRKWVIVKHVKKKILFTCYMFEDIMDTSVTATK